MTEAERKALLLRNEIAAFLLNGVADHDAPFDTGGGMGSEDIHVTVDGVRFRIEIHWPQETTHGPQRSL